MKIIDIEGIGPAYATKLIKAGIRSTEALLKKGASDKGRQEIAAATGIHHTQILEWVNRRAYQEEFPIGLFGIIWLLQVIFIFTLMPIIHNFGNRNKREGNPFKLLLNMVLLIIIAWLWIDIIQDQMPCFLGIPNCD